MGVYSIRADKLLATVPSILHEKEAFISGQFLCLCSGSLIFLFDGHFMTFFFSPIFLKVKSMKTVKMFLEDCVAPS